MNEISEVSWHSIIEQDILEKTGASIEHGLTSEEVLKRRAIYGSNALTPKKGHSPLVLFLLQFRQPLVYILVVASIVTAYLREFVDSAVIFGVVLINAIVGFIQESKAIKAIEALSKSMTSEATVIRDGKKKRISASELTFGDTVLLQSGDKVPADLRLIDVRELQINESMLTGESLPVYKKPKAVSADTVLADRENMAYSSTLVTFGTAAGVVVEIGDNAEVGKINQMIASAEVLATPLTKKISHFSGVLLYVIIGLALITFLVGLLRGESVFDMFMAAVALSVGAIPEGLPAALTIILALGVSKMAKRNAIIRKLPAVETLGSTSIICTDKTGTLTKNQMTVESVFANEKMFEVAGVGYSPEGEILLDSKKIDLSANEALRECLLCGVLCNDSNLVRADDDWKIEGDPTEGALISSAAKAHLSKDALFKEFKRIDAIPFESQHQYMVTLHSVQGTDNRIIYMKGSVESVLSRCSSALGDDKSTRFDSETYHNVANQMAGRGLRVLAFARCACESGINKVTHDDVSEGMTFLGFQAMIDPPRPEAIQAVKTAKKAGIKVKMITGDHEITAFEIARKIGIIDEHSEYNQNQVLNGKHITVMSDEELISKAQSTSVFARVAPEDKLRLVKALQVNGDIIAMTGDGVNDGPSLRQANIGIAMGITGTDVAKESGDMVLTDDNFATIEAAIEEGRGVYDNLIKFITWTLPTNFGEGLIIIAAILVGVALPILPVQILWINMTTAIFLGLMLAFEPKEAGIMDHPPRKQKEPILTSPILIRIIIVGALLCASAFIYYKYSLLAGRSEAVARTIAVNIFVFGELFYLFNCRSLRFSAFKISFFSNKILLGGVGIMILAQICFTYLPAFNVAFQSEPILFKDWIMITGLGILIFLIIELVKIIQIRHLKGGKGL